MAKDTYKIGDWVFVEQYDGNGVHGFLEDIPVQLYAPNHPVLVDYASGCHANRADFIVVGFKEGKKIMRKTPAEAIIRLATESEVFCYEYQKVIEQIKKEIYEEQR